MLPRFVSPPVFACLWLLLGLLILASSVAWWAEIPVFVTGTAVIVAPQTASFDEEPVVIAFLSPDVLPRLQPGQPLSLHLAARQRVTLSIIEVVPDVKSPHQIRERWPLAGTAVYQPAAVALAHLEPSPAWPASLYDGSQVIVEVEVGSRRAISFLPVLGRFFE